MNDAMLRQRIHDILERKIEMEGGARRRRRKTHGDRIIINKHGKPVSYKKHMQGVKLAKKYGFRKGHRGMRGGGMDDDDLYGYGYVPELYNKHGPIDPVGYCYKGKPGIHEDDGPLFYNPYTGKCEESLYGKKLAQARTKYARNMAKNRVKLLKPMTADEQIYDQEYKKIYGTLTADLKETEKYHQPYPGYIIPSEKDIEDANVIREKAYSDVLDKLVKSLKKI